MVRIFWVDLEVCAYFSGTNIYIATADPPSSSQSSSSHTYTQCGKYFDDLHLFIAHLLSRKRGSGSDNGRIRSPMYQAGKRDLGGGGGRDAPPRALYSYLGRWFPHWVKYFSRGLRRSTSSCTNVSHQFWAFRPFAKARTRRPPPPTPFSPNASEVMWKSARI